MSALGFPLNFPEISKKENTAFPTSLCHRYHCIPVLASMLWAWTDAAGEVSEPRTVPWGSWARTSPHLPSSLGLGPQPSLLG